MTHTSPAVSNSFLGCLQTTSDTDVVPEALMHVCVQADAGAEGLFQQALEHCPALVSCFLHGTQLLTCSFSPRDHDHLRSQHHALAAAVILAMLSRVMSLLLAACLKPSVYSDVVAK